ncbi:guanylate kinase [Dehalococcoidia bacterium]|nr:guanylate kinase [Dehalococcoidia bacterium]
MTSHRSSLVIVISGPSGVGKDTVLDRMKHLRRPWQFVVTATTRSKRTNERDGVEYIFMKPSEFQALLVSGEFLEHAEVYGNSYGVPKAQVENALQQGNDIIVKTDVQGARSLKAKIPDALLIFLAPPDMNELERRLKERKSETKENLEQRIETARLEMQCQAEFDEVVVNHSGQLDETMAAIDKIVANERKRRMC